MSIKTLKSYLESQLKIYNSFDLKEFCSEFDYALEICAGLTKKDVFMGSDIDNDSEKQIRESFLTRFKTGAPLAQILGSAIFMGQKFKVNEHTLIPRPETELLVKKAVEIINQNLYKNILDIGTGTGCIACMIAKNTAAQVLGLDISNEALHVALDNAMALNLMNRAIFRKSDLFSSIDYINGENFDMIVSNPPYIPKSMLPTLQPEVRDFEPHQALFTEDECGIEYYEKIISKSKNYLKPHGHVIFELGAGQSEIVKSIFLHYGFSNIEIIKDVSGTERVIVAQSI